MTTDLIVGFPGETDADFDETLAVVAEAAVRLGLHVHLLAAGGDARGGDGRASSCPTTSSRERFARLVEVLDRSALRRARRARGAREEVLVEGPSKTRRRDALGADAPGQARALRGDDEAARRRARWSRCDVTHGAPHSPARRAASGSCAARATARGSRSPSRDRGVALVGATASGKSRAGPPRRAVAPATRDLCARRDDRLPRAWTSPRPSRRARSAPRSATTSSTSSTPTRSVTVAAVPGGRARRGRRAPSAAGRTGPLRRRHRALRARGPRRPRDPRVVPRGACRALEADAPRRPARALRRAWSSSTRWPRAGSSRATRDGSCARSR